MKVVCLNIPPIFVTIKIKINGIYDAFQREYSNMNGLTSTAWFIKDDLGNVIPCDGMDRKKYFITLEDWRSKQLNELEI